MKLSKLKLKNFAKFEDFEMVFNDDITHLMGMNGDGKTTVGLTAIWAGFKGIAEKSKTGALIGQRFRFITEGKKSLDVEITLHDEKKDMDIILTRHITKTANTIKIDSSSLYPELTKEYMENLFNVAFLSASHFSALTGQQQAEAMGINTSKYDNDLIEEKDKAKDLRRYIKNIGTLTPVEHVEYVDIEEVLKRRKIAIEHNTKQSDKLKCINTYKESIQEYKDKIEELKKNITTNQTLLVETEADLEKSIDVEVIEEKIKNISETNKKAAEYDSYQKNNEQLISHQESLKASITNQKNISTDRLEYLQSKSFGIKNLSINENGELIKDGKLIRPPYFSKGELEMLVARIAMNLNPELKVRFIDDFEMLDDINQEKLIKNLTKRGFQIITATVGNKKKGDKSVLLRECKVIGGSVNTKDTVKTFDNPEDYDDIDNLVTDDEWDDPDEPTIYSNDAEDCEDRTPADIVEEIKEVPVSEASNTADDFGLDDDDDDDDDF